MLLFHVTKPEQIYLKLDNLFEIYYLEIYLRLR